MISESTNIDDTNKLYTGREECLYYLRPEQHQDKWWSGRRTRVKHAIPHTGIILKKCRMNFVNIDEEQRH